MSGRGSNGEIHLLLTPLHFNSRIMAHLTFYKELEYTPQIEDVIKHEAEQTIALYIKNVPDTIDHEQFYMQLSKKIGYFPFIDEDPITAKLHDNTWMEIRYTEERKTEAYKLSNLNHPLHTDYCDMPQDFLDLEWSCLYCVATADIGGGTLAVDPELLLDVLQTREPALYNDLISIPVIFERPGAIFGANTSTIISSDEIGPLFCWNYNRVAAGNTPEAKALCNRFNDFLVLRILGGGLAVPVYLKKGEALIFQDKRFLHGRYSFYGNRFLRKTPIIRNNIEQAKEKLSQLFPNP